MRRDSIDVSNEMGLFKKLMEEKGYKNTSQRDDVVRWIFQVHEHFSVDDILTGFRKEGVKLAAATVYRVVNLLLELGMLAQHDFGKGAKYYEHTPGHSKHNHIICLDCNEIIEFNNDRLNQIVQDECKQRDFTLKDPSIYLYVHCSKSECLNLKKQDI